MRYRGRRRAVGASPVIGPSSLWSLQVGQNRFRCSVGLSVYGVALNASKPVRYRADVLLAAGGPTLDARGTSREVLHRDDWVRVMGARRDEEGAPPVRLRRWGSSWSPGQTPARPPASLAGFCRSACWRGPWGSGAAAPSGALRAIDGLIAIRAFGRAFDPRRPRRPSQPSVMQPTGVRRHRRQFNQGRAWPCTCLGCLATAAQGAFPTAAPSSSAPERRAGLCRLGAGRGRWRSNASGSIDQGRPDGGPSLAGEVTASRGV
jgi:hypothetical protein